MEFFQLPAPVTRARRPAPWMLALLAAILLGQRSPFSALSLSIPCSLAADSLYLPWTPAAPLVPASASARNSHGQSFPLARISPSRPAWLYPYSSSPSVCSRYWVGSARPLSPTRSSARSRVLFPARQCALSARSTLIPNRVVDLVVCRQVVEPVILCSNTISSSSFALALARRSRSPDVRSRTLAEGRRRSGNYQIEL
jgi:hypothetical protein